MYLPHNKSEREYNFKSKTNSNTKQVHKRKKFRLKGDANRVSVLI